MAILDELVELRHRIERLEAAMFGDGPKLPPARNVLAKHVLVIRPQTQRKRDGYKPQYLADMTGTWTEDGAEALGFDSKARAAEVMGQVVGKRPVGYRPPEVIWWEGT